MPSHTICCTCGNILKLANAIAGAKVVCSRCQKIWTVPELPAQAGGSVPSASRRPVVVRKKSSPAGTIAALLGLGVAVAIGAVFLLKGDSTPPTTDAPVAKKSPAPLPAPEPPYRAPRTEPEPVVAPPPPAVEPAPPPAPLPPRKDVLANPTLQEELDLLIYRINTTGLTARVLELRGKKAEAAPLNAAMGIHADLEVRTSSARATSGTSPTTCCRTTASPTSTATTSRSSDPRDLRRCSSNSSAV
jgi:hypothetical protein